MWRYAGTVQVPLTDISHVFLSTAQYFSSSHESTENYPRHRISGSYWTSFKLTVSQNSRCYLFSVYHSTPLHGAFQHPLSVCHQRPWRFLLTELKSIHVDLWTAHFLQCTDFSFFHLLTLFYNNVSVGFAPVYVPSCKSIWTDHVYFPVEGTLRTS